MTPSLTGTDVLISLLAYMAVYLVMFPAGIAVMARMVRQGPNETVMQLKPVEALQSGAPIIALAKDEK